MCASRAKFILVVVKWGVALELCSLRLMRRTPLVVVKWGVEPHLT